MIKRFILSHVWQLLLTAAIVAFVAIRLVTRWEHYGFGLKFSLHVLPAIFVAAAAAYKVWTDHSETHLRPLNHWMASLQDKKMKIMMFAIAWVVMSAAIMAVVRYMRPEVHDINDLVFGFAFFSVIFALYTAMKSYIAFCTDHPEDHQP